MWEIAVHLAVACDVYDGVFLCCSCSHGGVFDEILNLIESVSEGFPSYFYYPTSICQPSNKLVPVWHKTMKAEGWVPPSTCCAQNTVPPPSCPYGHNTMEYCYLTFFLGRDFTCSYCINDKLGKGIVVAHQKILRQCKGIMTMFRLSF